MPAPARRHWSRSHRARLRQVDGSMTTRDPVQDGPERLLGEDLEGLLEFTGATAGWVGLQAADGRLTFPAKRGAIPDDWLALQRAEGRVWGFAVREGPTLLNDLRGLQPLGMATL